MERVFTLKKRFLFPVLLFIFIAIIFTIGCTNHLLKPHQSDLSILVKLEKSSGRNITTGDYQITTWIENRDGTESHHQEINSTAGADASIIFEELAIGSEINIHLEVVETGTTGKKLVGTSDWITVNEGSNVVVIVLREDSDTGEIDDPVAGDDPEDEGDPVLSRFEAQYDPNQYQLINTNIDPSKITITQHFNDGSTNVVKASEVSNDYNIAFAANASINSSIGNVPATVTHGTVSATFTIPVKYTLDASHLTLNGTTSVEQNGTLELTANYPDTTYQIYDDNGGSTTYKVKENLNISWTGATAQSDAWKATANTQTTGQNTATVKLTSTDTEWYVTTSEITASHSYTVTAVTQTYNIGDEYRDDSGTLIGYVFEVSDSYIKIVETSESWDFYWCGQSKSISNWSVVGAITDGEAMYSQMETEDVTTDIFSIFNYAAKKNEQDSGWYIPTKDELIAIYNMNHQYSKLSNLSGAYWSSSISSTTDYKAFYVIMDDGTFADEFVYTQGNSVVAVKKIEL